MDIIKPSERIPDGYVGLPAGVFEQLVEDNARMRDQLAALAPVARDALISLISDISEAGWAASWMTRAEYALWEIVESDKPAVWGMTEVTAPQIAQLKKLSNIAGGWPGSGDGPQWYNLADWRAHYAEWARERAKS